MVKEQKGRITELTKSKQEQTSDLKVICYVYVTYYNSNEIYHGTAGYKLHEFRDIKASLHELT